MEHDVVDLLPDAGQLGQLVLGPEVRELRPLLLVGVVLVVPVPVVDTENKIDLNV